MIEEKEMMVFIEMRITSPASSLRPDLRTVSAPSLPIKTIETVSAA